MVATAVAIAASIAQIAWFKWKGKVSPVHWLSLAIIVVFGGATLILQDEVFIKWKPTVLYGAFGLILASGKLIFGRDLIGYVLKDITLPPAIWSRVTWSWVAFFAAMAVLNWYVAFHYSDRHLGQFQGMGRNRPVPRCSRWRRVDAGPLRQRAAEAMSVAVPPQGANTPPEGSGAKPQRGGRMTTRGGHVAKPAGAARAGRVRAGR